MQWEVVIGLEIHVQLACKSKIFSGASTAFGAEPNTQACAVDLGLPGVLPVFNKQAAMMAVKFGLACDCEIARRSIFARKNYFYPDLPKGYQISQYEIPIVGKGSIEIQLDDGRTKTVGITRAHMEEDAGKSLHEDFAGSTGIDLNRAGTPLLEIVSEPDMRSAKEAVAYMKKIHSLVRYLGISDGNMQEGSFRCDANVSVRPKGQEEFGTRAEIKNLNSFKFIEKAINVEVDRQITIIEDGGEVVQETRLYDSQLNDTRSMRSKEEANDYRYFPDPDLLPVVIDEETIEEIRQTLPELPDQKKQRYIADLGLSENDAEQISARIEVAAYFEELLEKSSGEGKLAANWVTGDLAAALNKDGIEIEESPVTPELLAGLLKKIADKSVTSKIAKNVFEKIWSGEGSADEIVEKYGWKPVDTSSIEPLIDEIIANNPGQVEQYRGGKEKLFSFFVGQVMKATKGQADPAEVSKLLKAKLAG